MPTDLALLDDRESRYPVLLREREKFAHRDVRRHRHRIAQHPRFEALDLGDFPQPVFSAEGSCGRCRCASCAMAIAKRDSVTVSIAAETSGMLSWMCASAGS